MLSRKWLRHIGTIVMLSLIIGLLWSSIGFAATDNGKGNVLVLEVEEEIEGGLYSYLERYFVQAQQDNVDLIVLKMDTPGGQVNAAQDIKKLIFDCPIDVVCYIENQGISAGAYLALACDKIAMRPGSTIGDAELRIGTEKAEEKYLSVWREEFAALAEVKGRDGDIARAMVDSDYEIEGLVEKGKLLVLSADKAHEVGFCEYIVNDLDELLGLLGFEGANVEYGKLVMGDKIARFLTNSLVAPLLLGAGIIFIVMEIFTAGAGFMWIPGVICLALYFGGHMMAGLINWLCLVLFIVGVVLCLVEVFMPGFGIFGAGGIVAIVASIFLTAPDMESAVRYLVIVIIMLVVAIPLILKFMQKRKVLDRLLVKKELTTEDGYVSRNPNLAQYMDQEGKAFTVLRPAGTMVTQDGVRLDVVTRGEYIEKGTAIKVVGLDGTWLIVEKIAQE